MYLLTINAKAIKEDQIINERNIVICKTKSAACREINRYLLALDCFEETEKIEKMTVKQINKLAKEKVQNTINFFNNMKDLKNEKIIKSRKIFVKLEKMEF